MMPSDSRHPHRRTIILCAGTFLLTLALAQASVAMTLKRGTTVCVFWPLAGVLFHLHRQYGAKIWLGAYPALMVNALLAGAPPIFILFNPVANWVEAVVALRIFGRLTPGMPYGTIREALRAFILAPCVGAVLSGLIGVSIFTLGGGSDWHPFLRNAALWSQGNALGAIILVPALMAWSNPATRSERFQVILLGALSALGATALHLASVDFRGLATMALTLPILLGVLAGALHGMRGATTVAGVTLGFFCCATAIQFGPFVADDFLEEFCSLGAYGLLLMIAMLPLGGMVDIIRQEQSRRAELLRAGRVSLWNLDTGRLGFIGVPPDAPVAACLLRHLPMASPVVELEPGGNRVFSLELIESHDRGQSGILRYVTAERRTESERLEHAVTQARLRGLRSFLEPHTIFNALAGLRAILRYRPDDAPTYVEEFSRYLRHSLDAGGQAEHSLHDEWEFVLAFAAFRRHGCDFTPVISAPDFSPDDLRLSLPTGALHVLVENAIKHGSPDASGTLPIAITLVAEERRKLLRVSQPGLLGATPDASRPGGLRFVRDQLALHHPGRDDVGVSLFQSSGDVVAELALPH